MAKPEKLDARTPKQLAKVSAEKLLQNHPIEAEPNRFLNGPIYAKFRGGRKFTKAQCQEFETAYREHYEKLCQAS